MYPPPIHSPPSIQSATVHPSTFSHHQSFIMTPSPIPIFMNYNPPTTSPPTIYHPPISYPYLSLHCPSHSVFYLSIHHPAIIHCSSKTHSGVIYHPSTFIILEDFIECLLCAKHYSRCSGQSTEIAVSIHPPRPTHRNKPPPTHPFIIHPPSTCRLSSIHTLNHPCTANHSPLPPTHPSLHLLPIHHSPFTHPFPQR